MKPKEIAIPDKQYFAWPYEKQTQVKHSVLSAYAKIWISKLGSKRNTLFFDCHGGCGAYIKDDGTISYGSSIIVKQIADKLSEKRTTKTGVYYCEKDQKTYNNFVSVMSDLGISKIVKNNDCFENVISNPSVMNYYNNYPTLFLIDPFGYNLDIGNLSGLMKGFGNEIILNFMFDYISRFLSVSSNEKTFNTFFGTDEWKCALALSGQKRENYLVDLMKNRLKDITGAKYVFPYRLCFPNKDQTYYYLIHVTNHIDGITLMKEAFASVNNGKVQYLGKHNDEISLFDFNWYKADDIYKCYLENRKGRRITVNELWESIVEETAYTKKDLAGILDELVNSNKICVERKTSKRGSYRENDVITVM